jgi:sirohydrochlorin ferrochelatase
VKHLLIVAHGSRRAESNDEVRELTERIKAQSGDEFADVRCAFLELAEPLIPDGVIECINNGATEVVVLPYFLSAGRHVVTDIPEEVEKAQQQYPDVKVTIAPYLGSIEAMPSLMAQHAAHS